MKLTDERDLPRPALLMYSGGLDDFGGEDVRAMIAEDAKTCGRQVFRDVSTCTKSKSS